jgi:hypothetical protein
LALDGGNISVRAFPNPGNAMRFVLGVLLAAAVLLPAIAQNMPATPKTAANPDPTHATFILPKDLKWK